MVYCRCGAMKGISEFAKRYFTVSVVGQREKKNTREWALLHKKGIDIFFNNTIGLPALLHDRLKPPGVYQRLVYVYPISTWDKGASLYSLEPNP